MHSLIYTVLFAGLAQAPTAQLTAQLEKTVLYREPAISPDGKWVAWAQTAAGENRPQVHLQRVDEKTAAVVRTAAGPRRDSSPAFSPDSKNLAFFSTAGEKDQAQLWTLALGNSSPALKAVARKRTSMKGFCDRPQWSPDGNQIAFFYVEGGEGGGPLHTAAHCGRRVYLLCLRQTSWK